MRQKNLIREKDWDCLVVLDACRYDIFERVYEEYISGSLKKVRSPGSDTPNWLSENFKDTENFEDVVYVSSNPFVNSKGVVFVDGFDANELFWKVMDVWDWKFNLEYMTVLPEVVRKAATLTKAKYPDKKMIIHFMQPHWPYLSREPLEEAYPNPFSEAVEEEKNKGILGRFSSELGRFGKTLFGKGNVEKLKKILGLSRTKPEEMFARKYGSQELKKAYEENLRLALEEVVHLVDRIPEDFVITSDHGEFLGENDYYSHLGWNDDDILREVPWFNVRDCNDFEN